MIGMMLNAGTGIPSTNPRGTIKSGSNVSGWVCTGNATTYSSSKPPANWTRPNVATHRYYLPSQLKDVAKIVQRMAASAPLTVRRFRDETGIGRNVAIEVLEYFYSKGFTRRHGTDRIILNANIFD